VGRDVTVPPHALAQLCLPYERTYFGAVSLRGRSAEELATSRNIAGGVFALLAAAAALALTLQAPAWLKIVSAGLTVVGAVVGLWYLLLEWKAKRRKRNDERRDAARAALRLLRTTVSGHRDQVPHLSELSAYDLGTDPEAISPALLDDSEEGSYTSSNRSSRSSMSTWRRARRSTSRRCWSIAIRARHAK
jgi:hypothetical protein